MTVDPRTHYVDIDGYALAYQVLDGGSRGHAVWYQDLGEHLDLVWTDPSLAAGFGALSGDVAQVLLQHRGVGLSPPVEHVPTLERQAADLLAVMDAAGVRHATLVGTLTTCAPVCLLAAQHPERVGALVLLQPYAQGALSDLDPRIWDQEAARAEAAGVEEVVRSWGTGGFLKWWNPALDTPYNRRLMGMTERCSVAPGTIGTWVDTFQRGDYREVFSQVRVPTRVLRAANAPTPESVVRGVAELIPDATYEVLPPSVLGDSLGEAWTPVFDRVRDATVGAAGTAVPDRVLASVLFTDIVGSTEHLARLGDASWREVLRAHEQLVRRQVAAEGGRVVKFVGDGSFSTFPGPAAAVRCGRAICQEAPGLGVEIRAGVHAGECEQLGDDLAGMAIHISARVSAAAGPSEVLVSRTVRDLVAGSALRFSPRGEHTLKGVPDRVELYGLGEDSPYVASTAAEPLTSVADRTVVRVARAAPGLLRAANRAGNAWQRRRARNAVTVSAK